MSARALTVREPGKPIVRMSAGSEAAQADALSVQDVIDEQTAAAAASLPPGALSSEDIASMGVDDAVTIVRHVLLRSSYVAHGHGDHAQFYAFTDRDELIEQIQASVLRFSPRLIDAFRQLAA